MAISPAGQFDYVVPLTRRGEHEWGGRAMPPTETKYHPGIVGRQPDVVLSADTITLHRTEDALTFALDPHYRRWRQPRLRESFKVGPLLARVVEQSDVLHIHRGGTAEVGLVLSRQGVLVMALGAVRPGALGDGNTFTEDSRAGEVSLYGVRNSLDDPDWLFVWLNTSEADIETLAGRVDAVEGNRLLIAIAGEDPNARWQLNHRLATPSRGSRHRSACYYIDVDGRFATREQWLAYIRQLPQTRPLDLHIHFQLGTVSKVVLEHEYVSQTPWHLFVQRVYTPGLPGDLSQLAIVREHRGVTREMVLEAARTISSRSIVLE
jgi:hypothetical protein